MVVHHAQPAPDGKVVIAENIRALQAEQQNHFRRPDADALQTAQCPDSSFITHMRHGVQIECTRMDPFGKVRDIRRLAERHAKRLQARNACGQNGFGIDRAQRVLHSLPDRRLRLR